MGATSILALWIGVPPAEVPVFTGMTDVVHISRGGGMMLSALHVEIDGPERGGGADEEALPV